jgi:DNA-directed DNA polymerase III PolC
MSFPQLRIRTEYSFKQAFGPVSRVLDALKDLQVVDAAMVDLGTWGHVTWEKKARQVGIRPLFGVELPLLQEDGRKPTFWALAQSMRGFYRFSTAAHQDGADIPALLREAHGILRFAGAALTDPDTFDYIDINPASQLQQRMALRLHQQTGKPLVVTSDNGYPRQEDRSAFMAFGGREKLTPQHILSLDELRKALPVLSKAQFDAALANCFDIAGKCADALPKAPIIHFEGDLRKLVLAGKAERVKLGHIKKWTKEYQVRMERELAMIASKEFESYFLVVSDLVSWAKKRMLVGPGRGSSAGSLVCYLLRITEIDPLPHHLLFERFIDVTRNDFPDIDIDFNDKKRDECFDYLIEKYGRAQVARVGNISKLAAKSAIARTCERLAIEETEKFDMLNVLVEYGEGDARFGHVLEDTCEQTEPGRRFIAAHPEAKVMFDIENHASHTSVHASGVIVCNEPINEFCTVGTGGVMHADYRAAEALNLLKIDALGLTTLGIIEDAGCITADELYALKLDDPKVFDIFNSHRFTGVFQFEGSALRRVASEVDINSFRRIDQLTAIARPGPLGGGAAQHYIERANGREKVEFAHPSMAAHLAPTLGVILYQEQVMRICAEVGQFPIEKVSEVRKAIAKRMGNEYLNRRGAEFVAGAATIGVPEGVASDLWREMYTFGKYGMNASHTTAYGVISYWCAHMKAYHGLAYAAACLRGADHGNDCLELLRDMHREGIQYVAFDVDKSDVDWAVVDGRLIGGFMNLVKFGIAKATAAIEQRRAGTLDREKIAKATVRYAELFPLMAKYYDVFQNPENHGCRAGSYFSRSNDLPLKGDTLIICTIQKKSLRDENEERRIARRGRRMEGQTLFVDLECIDDGGQEITIRIKKELYLRWGKTAFEKLEKGDDIMVRGNRVENFMIVRAERVRCMNREVDFYAPA